VTLALLLKERKHPETVQENLSVDESGEGEERELLGPGTESGESQ
jgi:hypothetical protein